MVTPHQARPKGKQGPVAGAKGKPLAVLEAGDVGERRRTILAEARKDRIVVDERRRRIVPGVNNNGTWERCVMGEIQIKPTIP